MNILKAKQQVKDAIEAYIAKDDNGANLIESSRQRPLFLVGAPGIGKTAIMSQIASELGLGLVSYSMTHHTRQSALGLPFIVKESYGDYEYEASEYTMSEIVASVYAFMREYKVERGILFLDEINCVSETLYPSMLQFLQFKTFGKHKIPDGWIIVTAGNPPEYNKSVHDFDIVTLDRLKKIMVEPDFEAWKTYAIEHKTHPAILTFLSIKKDRFYSVEATLDGKSFVTARGWDDLSEIMLVFEQLGKKVDYDLIVQYVQNDRIAREFAAYYDLFNKYKEDYRIKDILNGVDVDDVLDRAKDAPFDERLSIIGLLLDSLCSEMRSINERTSVLIGVRDALRLVKSDLDYSVANVKEMLVELIANRESQLEARTAAGTISKSQKNLETGVLQQLNLLSRCDGIQSDDAQHGFSVVAGEFAHMTEELPLLAAEIEKKIERAFKFIEKAFGDKQELLVFETELTSRVDSARFIAQYGSNSYYSHNTNMILSERQRELRSRVESLDL